jgi:hypothetical protein
LKFRLAVVRSGHAAAAQTFLCSNREEVHATVES